MNRFLVLSSLLFISPVAQAQKVNVGDASQSKAVLLSARTLMFLTSPKVLPVSRDYLNPKRSNLLLNTNERVAFQSSPVPSFLENARDSGGAGIGAGVSGAVGLTALYYTDRSLTDFSNCLEDLSSSGTLSEYQTPTTFATLKQYKIAGGVVLVAGLGYGIYQYVQYKQTKSTGAIAIKADASIDETLEPYVRAFSQMFSLSPASISILRDETKQKFANFFMNPKNTGKKFELNLLKTLLEKKLITENEATRFITVLKELNSYFPTRSKPSDIRAKLKSIHTALSASRLDFSDSASELPLRDQAERLMREIEIELRLSGY
jgi:hypothetical protein